ncbi:MAG: Asp-tRNA(Asn)/Glu-tRNA(Gln) amidotransferase subunit GatC [Candidatus Pacebacteria bacterium]|nr:Asp-tRNA(Asn)/Glu-tRNA(Gln) amidotransferase subunit GatC [Candidatus Paceibacterota bacterium]
MIEKQEVLKIIELAKLKVEDEKIDRFQKDFSQILEYVSELKELDTENISETSHSVDVKNIERKDVPLKYEGMNLISREKEGYLTIKKILNNE